MYQDQLKELNEKRMHAWSEQKRLLDTATGEKRALTAEEKVQSDRIDADMDSLKDQVDQLLAAEQRALGMYGVRSEFDRLARPGIRGNGATRLLGDRLAQAVAAVRDGSVATATVETRSLTEAGAAGALVPFTVGSPELTMRAASVVLQIPGVRTIRMQSDRLRLPRVAGVSVASVAEATALGSTDADVDAVDLIAMKFGHLQKLSSELVEDAPADALGLFGDNLIESVARKLDAQFLEGTGAGTDLVGIRNVSGANSTSVAGTPSTFDKFADAVYELRADNGRPSAWVLHPRTWNTLSKIKTGVASSVETILEPSPQNAAETLYGLPVFQSSQLTLTEGATSVGSWAAVVDGTQLVIGERRPAVLEVSRDLYFDQDVIAVRCTARYAFAAINPEAISLATDIRA